MKAFSNLAGDVGLLAELQRPLIIGESIAGLAFRKIDIPDIVQAESLLVLVAYIALDLQGFLVGLQRFLMPAALRIQLAKINQRDAKSLLVATFSL